MTRKNTGLLALGGLLALASCGEGAATDPPVTEVQSAIIRPTANGGLKQVVMLYGQAMINGVSYTRTCSGSYFAPRVVLTAAHCLENTIEGTLYIYWGTNFEADLAAVNMGGGYLNIPAVGQPSVWSRADSFEKHPAWTATNHHPDMGVVYLDRKPPFDPLPLLRTKVANNTQVTLMGWGHNVATSPTSGTGSRVLRTGRSVALGSPTLADYHPEDPNPALLVPANLPQLLKVDGHAPNSNGCFGDSGGPIIVNQWGQNYIAGVASFTGLWCEEYSLYVRNDPFLPFLDAAYRKGGQAPLIPNVACVAENADGPLTAYFGYNNQNGVSITVPYGSKNYLPLDTTSNRPTLFKPGLQKVAFGVDFTPGQTVTYKLSPENSPTTTLTATASSPRCGPSLQMEVACGGYCRSFARSGCTGLVPYNACINACIANAAFAPSCINEYNAMNECYANTPAGPENWWCEEGFEYPFSMACMDIENAYYMCAFAF